MAATNSCSHRLKNKSPLRAQICTECRTFNFIIFGIMLLNICLQPSMIRHFPVTSLEVVVPKIEIFPKKLAKRGYMKIVFFCMQASEAI